MSMSKAEELIRVVREQIAYSTEDNSREPLDALIQAVRDEEWGRAVAAGLVESTACPRCSTEACSVCPANKTRYCP